MTNCCDDNNTYTTFISRVRVMISLLTDIYHLMLIPQSPKLYQELGDMVENTARFPADVRQLVKKTVSPIETTFLHKIWWRNGSSHTSRRTLTGIRRTVQHRGHHYAVSARRCSNDTTDGVDCLVPVAGINGSERQHLDVVDVRRRRSDTLVG